MIGIIAVVAGITASVYRSASAGAKNAACLNNLSQIGRAASLYMADHDETLPPIILHVDLITMADSSDIPDRYKKMMGAYGTTDELWFCPLDPLTNLAASRSSRPRRPLPNITSLGRVHTSYCHNLGLLRYAKNDRLVTLSEIENPSSEVHLMDDAIEVDESPRRALTAHGERANAVFFDAHVAAVPWPALISPAGGP